MPERPLDGDDSEAQNLAPENPARVTKARPLTQEEVTRRGEEWAEALRRGIQKDQEKLAKVKAEMAATESPSPTNSTQRLSEEELQEFADQVAQGMCERLTQEAARRKAQREAKERARKGL